MESAPLVEIGASRLHGWGVFARCDLPAGVTVEWAPYLSVPVSQWEGAEDIARYVFELDDEHVALALGTVSLYNHCSDPNAVVFFDVEESICWVETIRPVVAGAELCIRYGDDEDLASWNIDP